MGRCGRRSHGFSLVELVIVVIIIAVLAAVAIPRFGRAGQGASAAALSADLAQLRKAIEIYQAEHGGVYPADPTNQLTLFTDNNGNISPTKDTTFYLGPYLQRIPPLPVGANVGNTGISAADGAGVGWIYDPASGNITADTTTEQDGTGKLYSAY